MFNLNSEKMLMGGGANRPHSYITSADWGDGKRTYTSHDKQLQSYLNSAPDIYGTENYFWARPPSFIGDATCEKEVAIYPGKYKFVFYDKNEYYSNAQLHQIVVTYIDETQDTITFDNLIGGKIYTTYAQDYETPVFSIQKETKSIKHIFYWSAAQATSQYNSGFGRFRLIYMGGVKPRNIKGCLNLGAAI